MTSVTLAPPTGALVRTKIEVFNSKFSYLDAVPEDADVDIQYDQTRLGWMTISDQDIWLFSFAYEEDVTRCGCGEIVVDYDDLWIFGLEPLYKPRAAFYFDGDQGGPEFEQTRDSKVVVNVDMTGMTDDPEPVGTVWVYGVYEEPLGDDEYEPHYFTEYIPIDGVGSYPSVNVFSRVAAMACDFTGDQYHATVSLWGNTDSTLGRRECRIWIDANGDGIYGLVFAGYIYVSDIRPVYGGRRQVALKLEGYESFLQCNDYVCGYRCGFRCLNYSKTGESGVCLVNSTNFRTSASSCWIGDMDVRHPDGTLASTRCPDYNESEEVLPFDGWTYYKDYAPSTETGYQYCPPNYFRALQAACNMANAYEKNAVVSRPWTLRPAYTCTLSADIDNEITTLPVKWNSNGWWLNTGSYVTIGEEIMLLVGQGPTSIDVIRGNTTAGCTYPRPHSIGDTVIAPEVAVVSSAAGLNPLARNNRLSAPNLKQSIAATLNAMADTATIEVNDAPYIYWVDKFKQIHFSEFCQASIASDDTGADTLLELREVDFIDEPSVSYSDVVNQVTSRITLADGNTVSVKLTAEDLDIDGYDQSVRIFGRISENVDNPQLNSYGPITGKVDFLTWATNYLKIRAFPTLSQEVCVFGFVPDEHYWMDMTAVRSGEDDPYVLPYLLYTDSINKNIDLRGTMVSCPDYSLPVDEDGQYQVSTFYVQGVRTTFAPPGNLKTYLCLCRLTGPEDFI